MSGNTEAPPKGITDPGGFNLVSPVGITPADKNAKLFPNKLL
jgi:hypothetical protein